jgi:hypothetical protein
MYVFLTKIFAGPLGKLNLQKWAHFNYKTEGITKPKTHNCHYLFLTDRCRNWIKIGFSRCSKLFFVFKTLKLHNLADSVQEKIYFDHIFSNDN